MNSIAILNDRRVLVEFERCLLDELTLMFATEQTIRDDLLESLYFIYKNPMMEALHLIDKYDEQELSESKRRQDAIFDNLLAKNNVPVEDVSLDLVTRIVSETNAHRFIYRVRGSGKLNYYLFNTLNFCTCSSFKYNVLGKYEYMYCKHIVLAKLAIAMKKTKSRTVKDTELLDLLKLIK